MLLLYTAFLAPEGQNTHHLEFPREDPLGLPRPPEQFAALEELADGYHKRVRAFLGTYVAVAMLDTGSFRNCIDENILKMLEAKQEKGELGKKQVISQRRSCRPTDVDGAQGLPAHVMVVEGPAKIVDGKVKLFVCTNSPDEEVVLDTRGDRRTM